MKSKVLMKDLPSNCKIALHIVPGPSDTWMIKRMRMEDCGCKPPQTRSYQIYQDISRLAVVHPNPHVQIQLCGDFQSMLLFWLFGK